MSAPLDARQRSAETRRRRTRSALVKAARSRFARFGWQATRVEDVARDAHVGVATAFNHFSKQTLLGHAYEPVVRPVAEQAAADIARQLDPVDALTRYVRELATVGRRNRQLTVALLAAVQEQTTSVDGPPAPGDTTDVRTIVPLPQAMIDLVAYGQRAGAFRSTPSAADVGAYHTNALMLRVLTRPDESASATADIVLSQLLPGLLSPFVS